MGLKILMTTMSLDIGGAETHVVELSKRLKNLGCEVVVASNGGVYVAELEKSGIEHIKLPMHNKRPNSFIYSYTKLKKLIKERQFDVVHAHARIPAYICGLLQKKLGFRFVTTVHGTYEVTPMLKRISNWGDCSLAVSFDIKQYLIDNYGIPSDNITSTVNGIDMERFSKKSIPAIFDELRLKADSFKIVHVSRMDKEVSSVAHRLISVTEKLINDGINAELIVVGTGTDFEALQKKADRLNNKANGTVVHMCGGRTDVDRILSCADVFVGVSRAALEAMSEEIPTVLAGAQGYGGIFTKDLLELSLNTNFCFRGEALPEEDKLYNDIYSLMNTSKEYKSELGKYGRDTVGKYYSIERMGKDALAVYSKLTPYKPYKYGEVILSGYYGFGNMGDDSLLQAIVASLRRRNPDIKITVLSKKPKETAKRYSVKSIQRFDILKIIKHMKHAKLLVNGGGSLLQNSTSTRSLLYYIYIMKTAKRHGLKIMLYASGIGPLFGEKNKERVRKILNDVDIITLREKESYDSVLALGVKPKRMEVTLDPAFTIEASDESWVEYICEKNGTDIKSKGFAVSMRTWSGADADYEDKILEAVLKIKKEFGLMPIFVSMQKEKDMAICQRLAEKADGKVLAARSASELCTVLSKMQFVIAMRLHMLVYAASVGTPIIGLSYDPKIEAMMLSFKLPYYIDIRKFESKDIFDMTCKVYNNREAIRDMLKSELEEKKKLSDKDVEYVMELLK